MDGVFDEQYESNYEKWMKSLIYEFNQPHRYSTRFTAMWGIGLTDLQLDELKFEGGELDCWRQKQDKLWYHKMHRSAEWPRRFRKGWRVGVDTLFVCTFDQRKNHFRTGDLEAMTLCTPSRGRQMSRCATN